MVSHSTNDSKKFFGAYFAPPTWNPPNALSWYKTSLGNREWKHPAAMFGLKALASALLLSTAAFGLAVDSSEHQLVKRAQPKGIDVSSNQGTINWRNVADKGNSFAYIKATEGTSKSDGVPVVWSADVPF